MQVFLSILKRLVRVQVIDAHMTAMQNKWSWLLQLTLCLETHLKYSDASHRLKMKTRHCFGYRYDFYCTVNQCL